MNSVKDPKRILIACKVKSKNQDYANLETEYLFKTINRFGGILSQAQKMAYFNEKPTEKLIDRLKKLDVQYQIVKQVDDRTPNSHKIRILDEGFEKDVDHIVLLGTDIVCAKDFSHFVSSKKVKAKQVDTDPFSIEEWKEIFQFYNIDFPSARLLTSCEPKETIPYFNTDVLIIPRAKSKRIFNSWNYFIHTLNDDLTNLPNVFRNNAYFIDQVAFTLAILSNRFEYEVLPIEMNYPYIGYVYSHSDPDSIDPYLIHHHHCISESGEILKCPYKTVNIRVDMINKFLKIDQELYEDLNNNVSELIIKNLLLQSKFTEIINRIGDLPLNSTNKTLQYSLALSLQNEGIRFKEALLRYELALINGFNPFWVYFNRGLLHYKMHELQDAQKDLKKALKINPHNEIVRKSLKAIEDSVSEIN